MKLVFLALWSRSGSCEGGIQGSKSLLKSRGLGQRRLQIKGGYSCSYFVFFVAGRCFLCGGQAHHWQLHAWIQWHHLCIVGDTTCLPLTAIILCLLMYMCTCVPVYVCVLVCSYVYVYVCMCVCVYVCAYVYCSVVVRLAPGKRLPW